MPRVVVKYKRRDRSLVKTGLGVKPSEWGEWREDEWIFEHLFGSLDKRSAAALIKSHLNDDEGRGRTQLIQVRVLSVTETPE